MDDRRAVTAYAAACAEQTLVVFTRARPDDRRPAAAIEAGRAFADGATRSRWQRAAAMDATLAAQAATERARHAAYAASEAAAAAYLRPVARTSQVRHILGSGATPRWRRNSRGGTIPLWRNTFCMPRPRVRPDGQRRRRRATHHARGIRHRRRASPALLARGRLRPGDRGDAHRSRSGADRSLTVQCGLPPHLRAPEARAGWLTALDRFAAYVEEENP